MFLHESKTLCRRLILIGTKSGSSGNSLSSQASMYLSNILFTLLLVIVLHKHGLLFKGSCCPRRRSILRPRCLGLPWGGGGVWPRGGGGGDVSLLSELPILLLSYSYPTPVLLRYYSFGTPFLFLSSFAAVVNHYVLAWLLTAFIDHSSNVAQACDGSLM